MKLLLLTFLVASAFAAPSVRNKRSILPGDPRYGHDHQYHQDDHVHHENQAEIAKALESSSGCLVGPAVKSHQVPESRNSVSDIEALEVEVEEAIQKVIQSYAARIAHAKAAKILESSVPLEHEEHAAVAVKSAAQEETVAVEQAESSVPVEHEEPAAVAAKSVAVEETVAVEQAESSVSVEHEEPAAVAAKSVAVEETVAVEQAESSVPVEHEEPAAVAVKSVAQEETVAVEQAESNVPVEHEEPAAVAVKSVAQEENVAVEQVESSVPLVNEESAAVAGKGIYYFNDVVGVESTATHVEDAHPEEHVVEAKSGITAESNAEVADVPSQTVAEAPVIAKSDVDVHESETEVKDHVETEEAGTRSVSEVETSATPNVAEGQTEVQTQVAARSGSPAQDDVVAQKETPVASQTPVEPAVGAARASEKGIASEATDASATPAKPKSNFSYGSTYKSGYPVPEPQVYGNVHAPGFASGYKPQSNFGQYPGFNQHVNPGYGYHGYNGNNGYSGNNGYYNSNYNKFPGYNGAAFPGQSYNQGAYSGFDFKGKAVDPNFPHTFPQQYPVGYDKNVPYVHPQPFQFRSNYPEPQPLAPFPAIQQTKEQNTAVEASEEGSSPVASPKALVQPTVAPVQEPAAFPAFGQWGYNQKY